MILVRLIFVYVFIALVCGARQIFPMEHLDVEDRLTGGTVIPGNTTPWLVLIFKISDNVLMGYGGIIAKKWVITTSMTANNVNTVPADITVYSDILDSTDLTTASKHKAVQIVVHRDIVNTKNALTLLQVCPAIVVAQSIELPARGTTYTTSTTAKLYRYLTDLNEATKHVGSEAECTNTSDWDPTLMFCLAYDANIHGNSWDGEIPVVIDNKLAGFLMIPQDNNLQHGEQVIDLSKYRDWIFRRTGH